MPSPKKKKKMMTKSSSPPPPGTTTSRRTTTLSNQNRATVSKKKNKKKPESQDDEFPAQIYREMLAEVSPSSLLAKTDEDGKMIKKRRVNGKIVTITYNGGAGAGTGVGASASAGADADTKTTGSEKLGTEEKKHVPAAHAQQVVASEEDYTDNNSSSDDEDIEWENVELTPADDDQGLSGAAGTTKPLAMDESEPLEVYLGQTTPDGRDSSKLQRRKPMTSAEKRMRLEVHKFHLLCLLANVSIWNHWCNDAVLKGGMMSLLRSPKYDSLPLPLDNAVYRINNSERFKVLLEKMVEMWRWTFTITARGMRRSFWAEEIDLNDIPDDFEKIADKETFIKKAEAERGSRDFGAMTFCAALRSQNINARLVCSLQPLPFLGVAKGIPPQKLNPIIINASDLESQESATEETNERDSSQKPASSSARLKRIGRPEFTESASNPSTRYPRSPASPKTLKESAYPVFWVEAFNKFSQRWVPVDPIVTRTVGKASKLEPPMNDSQNNMSYVIAFNEDGTAIDVTRRYTKYYNAKTRKNRVDWTKDGEEWWMKTMEFYQNHYVEDRDQIEAGELAAKEASEPMPRNIQDYKDHPLYVLERHLRSNEVIHPKTGVGKVSVRRISLDKASPATVSIYRRNHVHVVKSAEAWYRQGREIKAGEEPLKRAAPRKNKEVARSVDDMIEEDPSVGLYAMFQTDIFRPPPVVDGRIPKNAYGNCDVYVPSMVPEGAFHLQHPQGVRAAKLLGIDYAEAVTGFEFKGRQGQPVFRGVVVASEYREALVEVLKAFAEEEADVQEKKRVARILRMWKQMLVRLRIKERVEHLYEELGGSDADIDTEGVNDEGEAGGFFPDTETEGTKPTAGSNSIEPNQPSIDTTYESGGFMSEENARPSLPRQGKMYRYYIPRGFMPVKTAAASPSSGGEPSQPPPAPKPNPEPESIEPQLPVNEVETASKMSEVPPVSDEPETKADLESKDDDSELDKASLMSHDPEDEDLELEWVDDAF